MPPRRRTRKGDRRLDAALDAMALLGFPDKLVSQTINELLKVYGKDGWVFIEECSYLVLIDALVEKQKEVSKEQASSLENGAGSMEDIESSAAGSSNGVRISTTCSMPEDNNSSKTYDTLEAPSQTSGAQDSVTLTNDSAPKECIPPAEEERRSPGEIKLDQSSRRKKAHFVLGNNAKDSGTDKNGRTKTQKLEGGVPIQSHRPCHGWISDDDDDDEDLVELSPEPLPQHLENLFIGSCSKKKRKSRWDVRPEDM
ncbi:uncharacterized protein LOC107426530 [Ziziphus jujuba]|uniref:Uncharacterized protein LOC107426530 n=2 Tax=Ziziphus jujuba TaxID=326968 RepID=A0A6P4ASP8_ZIZJJ|nr:uncharacterized protein LOC107426530 [Ziziphus jujuba]KAH7517762.1 hypothetical protein FEM48_Zijuj09G0098800 [Ziziphus jujuba var. spinosa]